ncbi:MAG: ZIP family metal transporter [Halobacteriota archaeon]
MIQQAFVAGLLAASALLFGSLTVAVRPVASRTIGLVMAFGSGALISSVSYELIAEAYRIVPGEPAVLAAFFAGAFTFYVGDVLIERIGGGKRKSARGEQSGAALGILLGSVLDGIPESFVLGISLIGGGAISLAYFAGVFLSNFPEGLSSTAGLLKVGYGRRWVLTLWGLVAIISAASAALGYTLFADAPPVIGAALLTFAGGAIITMLADSMMPEAFQDTGKLAGLLTALGFAVISVIGVI